MIPGTFKNDKANRYDLNDLLATRLKEKKYVVLYENKNSWPKDAVDYPCTVLNAELSDVSSSFKNKIQFILSDCNDKEITNIEGKSSIKDFEEGMRDALSNSLISLKISNPRDNNLGVKDVNNSAGVNTSLPKLDNVIVENKVDETVATIAKTEKLADHKAEVYSNGKLTLNKINLTNGEFILSNPNSSTPYGIFKPSTKKEVYRVYLNDNSATIGYIENGNIVVELANANGTFRKEVFLKK